MNTILVHLGCQGPYIQNTLPPAHLDAAIRQFKLFNNSTLYVLTDRENMSHVTRLPGVVPVVAEDYYSDKVDRFHAGYKYPKDKFWGVSTTRFMYLEQFVARERLAPCIHFENDVLIYFDVARWARTFKQLYGPDMAATPCDPDHLTSGFMYFGSTEIIAHMTTFFVDMIEQHGMYGFEKKYRVDMMNDMTLMKRYADTRGHGSVHHLPVLPFGEFGENYDALKGLFDPGGFGQFFAGTRGQGPGVTYAGHIVGAAIRANPGMVIVWQEENGLRIPYLSYRDASGLDRLARFNSLHIHNKDMPPFMSVTDA